MHQKLNRKAKIENIKKEKNYYVKKFLQRIDIKNVCKHTNTGVGNILYIIPGKGFFWCMDVYYNTLYVYWVNTLHGTIKILPHKCPYMTTNRRFAPN